MVGAPVVSRDVRAYLYGVGSFYAEKFTLILYLLLNKKAVVTFDESFTRKTAQTSQNTQMQHC